MDITMTLGTCKFITGVALILKKEDKILLLKRNISGKITFGSLALPGGTVENNETITQAACRKAKEKIGITINPQDISIVHVLRLREKFDTSSNTTQQILILYFAKINKWAGEPTNMEPHKHSDLVWADANKLPCNLFPLNKQALNCIKRGIFYTEHGW